VLQSAAAARRAAGLIAFCCWPTARSGRRADAPRPERGRPVRPAAVLRRPAEVRVQGAVIPAGANKVVFLLAPLVTCVLALVGLGGDPVAPGWVDRRHQCRHPLSLRDLSLGVYGIIMGGWASNSKYPFLGALRSAAQMVSYEVSIGFVIITVLLCVGSLNLTDIVVAQQQAAWHGSACRLVLSTGTGCRCSRCS
jgi:hypothetical protein